MQSLALLLGFVALCLGALSLKSPNKKRSLIGVRNFKGQDLCSGSKR